MNSCKPNRGLYFPLLIISISLTFDAAHIKIDNPWFTVLTGIGCGGISSVIIAWLVDAANCREKTQRGNDILGSIWATLSFILTAFPLMYKNISPDIDHEGERHTWIGWKDLLIIRFNKMPEEIVPESIKYTFNASTGMFVKEALYVLSQRAQLISDGIISERWAYSLEGILQEISLCKTMMEYDKIRDTAKFMDHLADDIQSFIEKDDEQKHMNSIAFHDLVDFDEEDEKARKHKRE